MRQGQDRGEDRPRERGRGSDTNQVRDLYAKDLSTGAVASAL